MYFSLSKIKTNEHLCMEMTLTNNINKLYVFEVLHTNLSWPKHTTENAEIRMDGYKQKNINDFLLYT